MKKTVYTLAWDTNEGIGSQAFPNFRNAAETLLSDLDEYADKASEDNRQHWYEEVRPELFKLIGDDGFVGFSEKLRTIDFEPLLEIDSFALDIHELEYPDPISEMVLIRVKSGIPEAVATKNVKILFVDFDGLALDKDEYDNQVAMMLSLRNTNIEHFEKSTAITIKEKIKALGKTLPC